MKIKILFLTIVLFVTFAIIGIANTAAFFTTHGKLVNMFTAGTVMINSGDAEGKLVVKNDSGTWDPEECKEVELTIKNTGSKSAFVRARLDGAWNFHRNIASVTAEYNYMVGDTQVTGNVQSSSDPVYYFYGNYPVTPECDSTSPSWFTAKDSTVPLLLTTEVVSGESSGETDSSIDDSDADALEAFYASEDLSSPSLSMEAESDNYDDMPVFIDNINVFDDVELLNDGDSLESNTQDDFAVETDYMTESYEALQDADDDTVFTNTMAETTTAKTVPEVNGLFYGDGDYELYNLIGISGSGSKLYSFIDGGTLYVALVVDRSVNDNVFDGDPDGGNQRTDYVESADWNNAHRFHRLIDSEFMGFTLSCGNQTWTWQQGYADQPDGGGPQGQNYDHTQPTWFSSHEAGAGSGTPPPGYVSSSSLVWNLNNYASGGSPRWDVTLDGTRDDSRFWKSPFVPEFPDDVTKVDGYPEAGQITFSDTYGWEWSMVYEFSVDISSCCDGCDIQVSDVNSHHSPAKTGPEDDEIPDPEPSPDPGIEIVKCVSVDGLDYEVESKVWYCDEPWPTLQYPLPDNFAPDFKFIVTNTDTVTTLTNIVVTDDVFGEIATIESLAPGVSITIYYKDTDWEYRIFDANYVSIELCDLAALDVGYDPDDWYVDPDGYYYYTEPLEPGKEVTLCVKVCLDDVPGDLIEGAEFTLYTCVDAVQASHDARVPVWGWPEEQ